MENLSFENSDRINDELENFLPSALHYNFHFPWEIAPIHFKDGEGHYLIDVDGNKYLDFFSKYGASILGHKNVTYINALSDAIKNEVTAADNVGNEVIIKEFLSYIPGAEQVRFSLSGTEAVQNALRLARAFTGKNKIIRFLGHYHGSADNTLGGHSIKENWYVPEELRDDVRGTAGRALHAFSDSLLLPWNNIETLKEVISHYENQIAAIIMEPIAINGGGVMPDKDYLKELKKIAKKEGILIIFDEIITGFRIQLGSVQSLLGTEPDIWVFGKAISGGSVPLSCVVSRKEIMDLYTSKRVTHGGTFNGYPLGLYALGATLNILKDDPEMYQRTYRRSEEIKILIEAAARKHKIPIVVQGHSMAMCLHATDVPLISIEQWSLGMKNREDIIRESFLAEKIILAPPCRIYPTIVMDEKVVSFVGERIDKIFNRIKESYCKLGYMNY